MLRIGAVKCITGMKWSMNTKTLAGKSGIEATHSGGRGEMFHDWFPYLEGFSPAFVNNLLEKYLPDAKLVLEPFAGTGTTPLSLAQRGISSAYCELNPVLRSLIDAKQKILLGQSNQTILSELVDVENCLDEMVSHSSEDESLKGAYTSCFGQSLYFSEDTFHKIYKLKSIERQLSEDSQTYFAIAVYSSLLEASFLKRAGDVRFRTEKEMSKGIPELLALVKKKLRLICSDIQGVILKGKVTIRLLTGDAKELARDRLVAADGVITSPPYLNGTNYFRNTKLELWYCGFLKSSSDLRNFRHLAITAGINDVEKSSGSFVLPQVKSVHKEISKVCYDARIPKMIAGYFNDMKIVFEGLQKNVKEGGVICIDIGDSLYSNVHVPTHTILGKVGKSIGWKKLDEVVLRERYSNNGSKLSQRLLVFQNEH